MNIKTVLNHLNQFFFKPQPTHNIALLRIALGIALFIGWISIWMNLELFWSENGLLSLETIIKYSHPYRINLFEYLPQDPNTPIFIALLNLFGIIGMTLGFFTRTSIAITLITLLSFHNRNYFILNSSDLVIRNFLFLLFLSHCGDMYSLDSLIRQWRGTARPDPVLKSPWALRLMQIQFCLIYIATVFFKVNGSMWADGTAVYYVTRLIEFTRMPINLFNNMIMIKFLTWSTLVIEFALGTLIWIKEFRYWVLLSGIALHLGIELAMTIPLFEWIMMITMLCMVEPKDIIWVIQKAQHILKRPTPKALKPQSLIY